MAQWNENVKHEASSINNGNQYSINDQVSVQQLNAITENSFYAVEKAEEAHANSVNAVEKAEEAYANSVSAVEKAEEALSSLGKLTEYEELATLVSQGEITEMSESSSSNLKNYLFSKGYRYERNYIVDLKKNLRNIAVVCNYKVGSLADERISFELHNDDYLYYPKGEITNYAIRTGVEFSPRIYLRYSDYGYLTVYSTHTGYLKDELKIEIMILGSK